MRGKKGFTIVEMLVVIAVLGVLVGIISTAAGSAIRQARVKRMSAMRTILQTGLATYYAQKGVWPGRLKTLSDQGTGGKKRRVEYLNETEADTVFKEVVAESRKGNPMMDISGLFVCDNPDSDTSRSKRHGTDLRSLIAAKKNIANVAYGYATKEEIEAVEDECRRGIELQAKEALKTSGDKLTEDEVMNLVYASREERP